MKNLISSSTIKLLAAFGFSALALNSQAATFTGAIDNQYLTAGNWSPSGVPATASGATAQINNGSAVIYTPGGDLTISNGGTLQVTNGSWTQVTGPAWIQLGGTGHLVVDGGTFNQGSSGNINIGGTGNTFSITSGAANFSTAITANTGMSWSVGGGTTTMTGQLIVNSGGVFSVSAGTLTLGGNLILQNGSSWSQTGGTVNLGAGGEFQFNSLTTSSMSGGVLNVPKLLTGVNGPLGSTFDFSGGTINVGATAFSGWYGADNANHPFNFTAGSTGVINFDAANTSVATVQGWLTAGGIQYNGAISPSDFSVTESGGFVTLAAVVPEPSTYALLLTGLGAVLLHRRRRQS